MRNRGTTVVTSCLSCCPFLSAWLDIVRHLLLVLKLSRHQMSLQTEHSTARRTDAERVRERYPGRVPVICLRHASCTTIPDIKRGRYLVSKDVTVGQFIYILRKRLPITSGQSMFIFTETGQMPPCIHDFQNLDRTDVNSDGFLYLRYATENTFGTHGCS